MYNQSSWRWLSFKTNSFEWIWVSMLNHLKKESFFTLSVGHRDFDLLYQSSYVSYVKQKAFTTYSNEYWNNLIGLVFFNIYGPYAKF